MSTTTLHARGVPTRYLLGVAALLLATAVPAEPPTAPPAGGKAFQTLDGNGDGVLQREETRVFRELYDGFDAADTGRDGTLSAAEFAGFEAPSPGPGPAGTHPTESWFTAPAHKPE